MQDFPDYDQSTNLDNGPHLPSADIISTTVGSNIIVTTVSTSIGLQPEIIENPKEVEEASGTSTKHGSSSPVLIDKDAAEDITISSSKSTSPDFDLHASLATTNKSNVKESNNEQGVAIPNEPSVRTTFAGIMKSTEKNMFNIFPRTSTMIPKTSDSNADSDITLPSTPQLESDLDGNNDFSSSSPPLKETTFPSVQSSDNNLIEEISTNQNMFSTLDISLVSDVASVGDIKGDSKDILEGQIQITTSPQTTLQSIFEEKLFEGGPDLMNVEKIDDITSKSAPATTGDSFLSTFSEDLDSKITTSKSAIFSSGPTSSSVIEESAEEEGDTADSPVISVMEPSVRLPTKDSSTMSSKQNAKIDTDEATSGQLGATTLSNQPSNSDIVSNGPAPSTFEKESVIKADISTDSFSSTFSEDIDIDSKITSSKSTIFASGPTSFSVIEESAEEERDTSDSPIISAMEPSVRLPTEDSSTMSSKQNAKIDTDEATSGHLSATTLSNQPSNSDIVSNVPAPSSFEKESVIKADISTDLSLASTFNSTTDESIQKQSETQENIYDENVTITSPASTSFTSKLIPVMPPQMEKSETHELLDISYYNSTSKTSFRLAVCLEGINCEADSERCFLVHQKCNEMFNVSVIPFKVRKKLSECSVDDILCHVENNDPITKCENGFIQCTKIVVPTKYLPSLKLVKSHEANDGGVVGLHPNSDVFPTTQNKTNVDSEIDVFLQILGDSIKNKPSENISDGDIPNIDGLTSSILEAIGETIPGGIDITDVNNLDNPIDAHLDDNNTLLISNEIVFLIDENQPGNALLADVDENTKETNFNIGLTNITTIFNPQSVNVETSNTLITELLRKAIVSKIKDQVHICNASNCGGNTDKTTHSNVQTPPHSELQSTKNITSNDLQVRLAICLSGIECKEEQVCLIAQEICIGKKAFESFEKQTRVAICECHVKHYLCVLAENENCVATKMHCVSSVVEKRKHIANADTYEKVIDKIADGITSMTSKDITQTGKIFVEFKNDVFEEHTKDTSEMILVSKPVKNEPRIMLTAINPDIQFDLEGKNKLQIEIETRDINQSGNQQQKTTTKQRIKEALRKIIIFKSDGKKSTNNLVDTRNKDQRPIDETILLPQDNSNNIPISQLNTEDKSKLKIATEQREEIIIDGFKHILNQTISNNFELDAVTIHLEQGTTTPVQEAIVSCCRTTSDGSEIESEIYLKVPGNANIKQIFKVPGSSIIKAKNENSPSAQFDEEELRAILKEPLLKFNENTLFPAVETPSNIDIDQNFPVQVSVSRPISPSNSKNRVKQNIKDEIIVGVLSVLNETGDLISGLNSLNVEIYQNPTITTPKIEFFCCNKSLLDQPNSVRVHVMVPNQLKKLRTSYSIPVSITRKLKDKPSIVRDDEFESALSSLVNDIDLDSTDLVVSEEIQEGSGFKSPFPLSEENVILPNVQISSVIPVNTLPENEHFKESLKATLIKVTQNVVGETDTFSGAEKVNIRISQNTKNIDPSIEVSCCKQEDSSEHRIANINVRLSGGRNSTKIYKIPVNEPSQTTNGEKIQNFPSHSLNENITKIIGSIDFEGNFEMTKTTTNDHSTSVSKTEPMPLDIMYESIIPIQSEHPETITKEAIADKIISSVQDIVGYSPSGHLDSLNIQLEEHLKDEIASMNISCCKINQKNKDTSANIIFRVSTNNTDTTNSIKKIVIPKTRDLLNLNTTALQKLVLEALDSITIENNLFPASSKNVLKPVDERKPYKSPQVRFHIPLQPIELKDEAKKHIKNNIIEGVKYAIDNNEKGQSSKESLRINAMKGSNVILPIAQTSCCKKDTDDDDRRIIDVKIRLKSKINQTLDINIPLDDYLILSENQETKLDETLLSSTLEKHLDNVIENVVLNPPNDPKRPSIQTEQQFPKPAVDANDVINSQNPNSANGESIVGSNVDAIKVSSESIETSHNFQSFPPFGFNISVNTDQEPILAGPIPNNINGSFSNIIHNLPSLRPNTLQSGQQHPLVQTSETTTEGTNGIVVSTEPQSASNTLQEQPSQTADTEKQEGSGLLSRIRDVIIALATALMVQNIGLPLGVGGPARKEDTHIGAEMRFPNNPGIRFNGVNSGSRPFIIKDPQVRKTIEESNAFFDGTSLNFTIPVQVREHTLACNVHCLCFIA